MEPKKGVDSQNGFLIGIMYHHFDNFKDYTHYSDSM